MMLYWSSPLLSKLSAYRFLFMSAILVFVHFFRILTGWERSVPNSYDNTGKLTRCYGLIGDSNYPVRK